MMTIWSIVFLNFIVIKSTIYHPESISIGQCSTEQSADASLAEDVNVIQKNKKVDLGATSSAKIIAVHYEGDNLEITSICKKTDSSKDYLHVAGDKVKIVLFQSGETKKLIFIGSTMADAAFQSFIINHTEKSNKYVHVESVKCIAESEVSNYKSTAATPKPFIEGSGYLCFIHDLISNSINVAGTSIEFVVSKYPQQSCPKCPDSPKKLDCNTP